MREWNVCIYGRREWKERERERERKGDRENNTCLIVVLRAVHEDVALIKFYSSRLVIIIYCICTHRLY